LTEEDRTWVRGRVVEARRGFVERLDDERHEDSIAVPDPREQDPVLQAMERHRVDLVGGVNQQLLAKILSEFPRHQNDLRQG
jgi:hypothetical protein